MGVLSMIYETRVYRCLPGRLPALLKRFDTVTLKLWEKHGIKQAGFFTTLVGESNQELTYLLAWESLADREKKWTAFQSDPEWIEARAKTEADGQIVANIVNQLLVPTAFSAVKEPAFPDAPRCRLWPKPDIRDYQSGLIRSPPPGMVGGGKGQYLERELPSCAARC